MCGIIGGWVPYFSEDVLLRSADVSLSRLAHRGPDDRGLESLTLRDGVLVLGHTRLSIIDLSIGGQNCARLRY